MPGRENIVNLFTWQYRSSWHAIFTTASKQQKRLTAKDAKNCREARKENQLEFLGH
jgi:hypothetical protein